MISTPALQEDDEFYARIIEAGLKITRPIVMLSVYASRSSDSTGDADRPI